MRFVPAQAFIFLVSLITGISAFGRNLTEKEILVRCYAHLTGERLPASSDMWAKLKAGRPAAKICAEFLDSVTFDVNGRLTQPNNRLHQRVLVQMNEFHKSWFDKRFINFTEIGDGFFPGTTDVHDGAAPALYLTRAMFYQGAKFQSVLRGTDNLAAIRAQGPIDGGAIRMIGSTGSPGESNVYTGDRAISSAPVGFYAPLVQSGTLLGVGLLQTNSATPRLFIQQTDQFDSTVKNCLQGNAAGVEACASLELPHNIFRNYGGGVLGNQSFLLINFGYGRDYASDGTLKLPRKWAAAAFKSFLCMEGPYLRPGDVEKYEVPANTNPEFDRLAPPFRKARSCLGCHASFDQAALTARGLTPASPAVVFSTDGYRRVPMTIAKYSATHAYNGEFWPWKSNGEMHKTPNVGKLTFRSMSGALVDRNVGSIDELGTAMTETDDFYACAASRYVEYFTGAHVPIQDPGASESSLTDRQAERREFVVGLGRELRTTGSVKTLIRRILESDLYRLSNVEARE